MPSATDHRVTRGSARRSGTVPTITARILRGKAPLREGLDPERATHLLLLYVGEDVNHVLVDTYRWPHEDWIDWTVDTLLHQVFGRASPAHHG